MSVATPGELTAVTVPIPPAAGAPVPAADWLDHMLRELGPDETVTHSGVSWGRYIALCDTRDRERPGVKLGYLDGALIVMSPSFRHEKWSQRLAAVIQLYAEEMGLAYESIRATTFRQEDVRAGLEADEAFYFANARAIADHDEIDLDTDPPPDVAIEVDVTTNSTAKLAIYSRIRVPEVWRFDGTVIHVLLRQADGRYAPAERSRALPQLPLAGLVQFLHDVRHLILSDVKQEARVWVKSIVGGLL